MGLRGPGDFYLEMGGTLAGLVMSQLATAEHPLFYIGFPITPAGNPFYAMAAQYANGHPYLIVDENNPSEKVAAVNAASVVVLNWSTSSSDSSRRRTNRFVP